MPKRLLTVVVPVCALGFVTVLAAAVAFVLEPPDATDMLGIAALLAASTLANRFPVPVEGVDSGGVSLSFVFGASALVLFGWEAGVLVAFAAPPCPLQTVPAERVAPEPCKEVVEHLLADPSRPTRRELEAPAVARQVAGLLEAARQVVERVELADGVVAEQVTDVRTIDRGEIVGRRNIAERVLERVQCLQAANLLECSLQPQRLVAAG